MSFWRDERAVVNEHARGARVRNRVRNAAAEAFEPSARVGLWECGVVQGTCAVAYTFGRTSRGGLYVTRPAARRE